MQINLKKRQLGRDKREFEPMASALAWRKNSNNWQWRPIHWEHEHLYSKYYYYNQTSKQLNNAIK